MILLPAIDMKDGKAVRLKKGDFKKATRPKTTIYKTHICRNPFYGKTITGQPSS